jgi:hypothetical protein
VSRGILSACRATTTVTIASAKNDRQQDEAKNAGRVSPKHSARRSADARQLFAAQHVDCEIRHRQCVLAQRLIQ